MQSMCSAAPNNTDASMESSKECADCINPTGACPRLIWAKGGRAGGHGRVAGGRVAGGGPRMGGHGERRRFPSTAHNGSCHLWAGSFGCVRLSAKPLVSTPALLCLGRPAPWGASLEP